MPDLIISTAGPVTTLTLNRPDRRNALSTALLEALQTAMNAATIDPTCRAVILRGAGPVFCAGLDFHEANDPAVAHRSATALAGVYRAIVNAPFPVIAAAHGAAFGGGAGLIAAADLAVVSADLQLGYPEVHRGLVAALVSVLLRPQLPARRLRELLLLGQTLTAAEAREAGLVDRLVFQDLDGAARDLAEQSLTGAPGAIARTKRLLATLDRLDEDLTLALDYHLQARNSSEATEGILAFMEKRAPVWGVRKPE
ncbi:MAG TPA: enoyl-CoA hydratase-related protein [Tepidisphaeraceae bacterium]|nr:enoyl-CoA hydratase-related protein [Tepidisphaeraceae bacterium]